MADDGGKFLLHELFFRTVEKFPNKVAVIFSGDTVESINFSNLGQAVRNLRFCLKRIFTKNEVVGVYSNPSLQLPAVLLAVLDSSAAFYPLATSLDAEKAVENLERYSVRYLLVESCFVQNIMRLNAVADKSSGTPRLMLLKLKYKELCDLLGKLQFSLFRITRNDKCVIEWDENLAYVMKTSGTTGEPKAVFVPHSCIVPNVIHLRFVILYTKFSVFSRDVPDTTLLDTRFNWIVIYLIPDTVQYYSNCYYKS